MLTKIKLDGKKNVKTFHFFSWNSELEKFKKELGEREREREREREWPKRRKCKNEAKNKTGSLTMMIQNKRILQVTVCLFTAIFK